ncbi:uncharacterized protein LOC129941349 [Eupeodes corollae]|uniref:uncharacterized protein LOC129941349 n=1 Tax=Eupeodes corollae TaxID=290404 RepID=UPI002493652A|nr:uncharacterized protein LOC129941349 [Eupeodes corollae]
MAWNMFGLILLLTLAIGIESANPLYILNRNGTLQTMNKTRNNNSSESTSLILNDTGLESIQFRKKHIDSEEKTPKNRDSIEDVNDLKYEVEILQPGRIEKEDLEIEERFKGPSLNFDTNEFIEENIEVNSQTMQQGHVILTIALIGLAVMSIGIYAGLVMWRSNLEKKYGMRQRLMTEDDFCTNIHDARPF